MLTTTPILKIADPLKDLFVCIGTCKEGLIELLIQENYVVAYELKKLKKHEKNYDTHDLELLAIIHALKMWQPYLIERKYLQMLDNISLKYLFNQQNVNVRQSRWLSFLNEYEFEIKHIKGKQTKLQVL